MTNLTDLFPAVPTYTPAMMQFDGSTGYYNKSVTSSGNLVTVVCRFNVSSFTGTKHNIVRYNSPAATPYARASVELGGSDDADTDFQDRLSITVLDNAGTFICLLFSNVDVCDGQNHTLFFSFNATTAAVVFKIDGADADNGSATNRITPTTGTLRDGASSNLYIGANQNPSQFTDGNVGFVGVSDTYLTNWSDFMYSNGSPRPLDQIGWTQWNGGTFQTPMMTFDGSTGYYAATPTTAGNKVTAILRFSADTFTGGSVQCLFNVRGSSNRGRINCYIVSSDHATTSIRNHAYFQVANSSGTPICQLHTGAVVVGNGNHTIFISFDGDTGTATFILDGAAVDDLSAPTRVAPVTGTLDTGVGEISLSTNDPSSGWNLGITGSIGFFGHREAYLTNWTDFMQADGTPKEIDEIGWKQWGGQPLFWNKGGVMTDNAGSAGAMTKNGTITGPSGGWPLFWNEHGQMSNNLGSAGDMTENGLIVVGNGGN